MIEGKRERAYLVASPANDPCHRLVRLGPAQPGQTVGPCPPGELPTSAEYEYAARLPANGAHQTSTGRALADDIRHFCKNWGK
ncbi:MAG: hypothetical protein R3A10_04675 [Caldilineaceae bacterium]